MSGGKMKKQAGEVSQPGAATGAQGLPWTDWELLEKLNYVLKDAKHIATRLQEEAGRQQGEILGDTWRDSLAKYMSWRVDDVPREPIV